MNACRAARSDRDALYGPRDSDDLPNCRTVQSGLCFLSRSYRTLNQFSGTNAGSFFLFGGNQTSEGWTSPAQMPLGLEQVRGSAIDPFAENPNFLDRFLSDFERGV